jgi:hypothetical protein
MIRESVADAIDRGIPSLMKHFDMNRNETLAHALTAGMNLLLESNIKTLEREPQVKETIRKLKSGENVTNDELEIILIAAKSGHLAARIIVEDFKRFGRSIDKE